MHRGDPLRRAGRGAEHARTLARAQGQPPLRQGALRPKRRPLQARSGVRFGLVRGGVRSGGRDDPHRALRRGRTAARFGRRRFAPQRRRPRRGLLQPRKRAVRAAEVAGGSAQLPPFADPQPRRHGGEVQLRLHQEAAGEPRPKSGSTAGSKPRSGPKPRRAESRRRR